MDIKSLPIKVMATATLLSVTAVPIAQSTNPVQHVAHGAETQATEKVTINDDVKNPNWKKLVSMNDQVDGKDATSIRFDDSKVEYGKEGTYDLIVTGQDKNDAELKQTIPVTIKKASDSNKDTPEIKRDSKDVDWANQLNISDEVDGQKVSDVKVDDSDVDVSKAGTYTVYVSGITDSGETVVDTYQVKVSKEAEDGSTSDDSNATSDDTSDNAKADDKKDDSAGIDIVPDDEKGDDAKANDSDSDTDTSSDDKSDDTSADDSKDGSKSDDAKADDKSDDKSDDSASSDDSDSSASGSSNDGKSNDAKADDKKDDSAGINIVPDDEKDGAKDGDKSDDKDKADDKDKGKDADKSDNDATVNDESKPSSESSDDKDKADEDKADEDKADESEDANGGGQPESDVSQPKPVPSESTPEQTSPQDDTQQPEGEGKGENPQELPDTGSETDNSPIIGGIVMMASAILGLASYLFFNRKKKSNQE